ncbi:MAG: methyltransferase domain-containing protein, partial [Candidatus Omnitrophica bacterium]|nr:methyltransferase domain-containing protein [Candidatus Omnitrophota bacterium]
FILYDANNHLISIKYLENGWVTIEISDITTVYDEVRDEHYRKTTVITEAKFHQDDFVFNITGTSTNFIVTVHLDSIPELLADILQKKGNVFVSRSGHKLKLESKMAYASSPVESPTASSPISLKEVSIAYGSRKPVTVDITYLKPDEAKEEFRKRNKTFNTLLQVAEKENRQVYVLQMATIDKQTFLALLGDSQDRDFIYKVRSIVQDGKVWTFALRKDIIIDLSAGSNSVYYGEKGETNGELKSIVFERLLAVKEIKANVDKYAWDRIDGNTLVDVEGMQDASLLLQELLWRMKEPLLVLGKTGITINNEEIKINTQNPNFEGENKIRKFIEGFLKYYIISDTHIADKTGADNFGDQREKDLMAVLDRIISERATLIINGDFLELWQAKFGHIKRRYGLLFRKLKEVRRIVYVVGNHDEDVLKKKELQDALKELLPQIEILGSWQDLDCGIILEHGNKADFYNNSSWLGKLVTGFAGWIERGVGVISDRLANKVEGFFLGIGECFVPDKLLVKKEVLHYLERLLVLKEIFGLDNSILGFGHTHEAVRPKEGPINLLLTLSYNNGAPTYINSGAWVGTRPSSVGRGDWEKKKELTVSQLPLITKETKPGEIRKEDVIEILRPGRQINFLERSIINSQMDDRVASSPVGGLRSRTVKVQSARFSPVINLGSPRVLQFSLMPCTAIIIFDPITRRFMGYHATELRVETIRFVIEEFKKSGFHIQESNYLIVGDSPMTENALVALLLHHDYQDYLKKEYLEKRDKVTQCLHGQFGIGVNNVKYLLTPITPSVSYISHKVRVDCQAGTVYVYRTELNVKRLLDKIDLTSAASSPVESALDKDARALADRLLVPFMEAYQAGSFEQAFGMRYPLKILGQNFGIFENNRNRSKASIDEALKMLGLGNIIDKRTLTTAIIRTTWDELTKIIQEMRDHQLRQMNQPGTVQIVRGWIKELDNYISTWCDEIVGWDISDEEITSNARLLTTYLGFLTPEAREEISKGNILLLGPGRHIHEILMLFQVLPNLKCLYVADCDMENLIEIKKQLDARNDINKDKIKLYHAEFNQLPFENSQFTVCYSSLVFHRSVEDEKHLHKWVSEVKRVLQSRGVYLTLGSTLSFFEAQGFTFKPESPLVANIVNFIASLDKDAFSQSSSVQADLERGTASSPVAEDIEVIIVRSKDLNRGTKNVLFNAISGINRHINGPGRENWQELFGDALQS